VTIVLDVMAHPSRVRHDHYAPAHTRLLTALVAVSQLEEDATEEVHAGRVLAAHSDRRAAFLALDHARREVDQLEAIVALAEAQAAIARSLSVLASLAMETRRAEPPEV
jgi:hypothetical protein